MIVAVKSRNAFVLKRAFRLFRHDRGGIGRNLFSPDNYWPRDRTAGARTPPATSKRQLQRELHNPPTLAILIRGRGARRRERHPTRLPENAARNRRAPDRSIARI